MTAGSATAAAIACCRNPDLSVTAVLRTGEVRGSVKNVAGVEKKALVGWTNRRLLRLAGMKVSFKGNTDEDTSHRLLPHEFGHAGREH